MDNTIPLSILPITSPALKTIPYHKKNQKLVLPVEEGLEVVEAASILYLEAQRNYTKVICEDKDLLISKNIGLLQKCLPEKLFFRVHKSYIVNVKMITRITLEGYLELEKGCKIRFTKNKLEDIKRAIIGI